MIKYLVRAGGGNGYFRLEETFDSYDEALDSVETMVSIIHTLRFGGFVEVHKYNDEDNRDVYLLEMHRII